MSYFLHDNDSVVTETRNPETGNVVIARELIPRDIPSLADTKWEDMVFMAGALGLQIGKKVRYTKKGTEVRDVFLTKVRGGPSPTGRNYPQLRIGCLFSSSTQDVETGEIRRWCSFSPEGEEQNQPAQTPTPATTPSESTESGDEAPAKTEAEQATAAVEDL